MLNEIDFEPNYNSYDNDLIQDFYSVALNNCNKYYRVSAYFSAKSISNMASGIIPFYLRGGKMKLIISSDISEEDYQIIRSGYENKKINHIYNKVLENFNYDRLSEAEKANIANAAYMIANDALEIKMVFKTEGIFHDKFGLMEDDNNCIYFRGSNNETEAAVEKNYESFDVTCSWLASEFEKKRISKAREQFKKLWNNEVENLIIMDLPDVIQSKILSFNKGKIINNIIPKAEVIKFSIDDSSNLYAKIGSKVKLNEKNYTYKIDIKRYIERIDGNIIHFKKDITYLKYRKIVALFQTYAQEEREKQNICYVETDSRFEKYMEKIDFKIKQRYKLGNFIKSEDEQLKDSFDEFKAVLDIEMERALKYKQLWNAFHIVKMIKSANFSVPGAGKTTIVYGAYAYLSAKENVDKLVVIGPKSSFLSWKNEYKLNFGEKRPLKVCDIQEINKDELIEKSVNANIVLINYEALPGIHSELKHIINEKTMLVFDEVHKIKGVEKVRSNVALDIAQKAIYKVVLTGTPIPNGYIDIYNMLNILYKDEYNDFFGFSTSYLKKADELDGEEINDKIYPFFCRISKKDLRIPVPDADNLIYSNVTQKEKMLYDAIKEKYKHEPFTYYIRMMQAVSNPELLLTDINTSDIENIFENDKDETLPEEASGYSVESQGKIDDEIILNIVNDIKVTDKFNKGIKQVTKLVKEGKIVLVWGLFTNSLYKIQQMLMENNITSKIINGDVTDLKQREQTIKAFLNKEFDVLIANPNTMAESVSLHSACHDAVYFEYSFNYTHMAQSRDRINRLGLSDEQYTRYYYLLCEDYDEKPSVDTIIYNRLKEKEHVMIKAIESGKLVKEENTMTEEILKLLKD